MRPNAWLMSDLALALPAFQLADRERESERKCVCVRDRKRYLWLGVGTVTVTGHIKSKVHAHTAQ